MQLTAEYFKHSVSTFSSVELWNPPVILFASLTVCRLAWLVYPVHTNSVKVFVENASDSCTLCCVWGPSLVFWICCLSSLGDFTFCLTSWHISCQKSPRRRTWAHSLASLGSTLISPSQNGWMCFVLHHSYWQELRSASLVSFSP